MPVCLHGRKKSDAGAAIDRDDFRLFRGNHGGLESGMGSSSMFGQTIATTREANAAYGGYQLIENRPADDVYAGRPAGRRATSKAALVRGEVGGGLSEFEGADVQARAVDDGNAADAAVGPLRADFYVAAGMVDSGGSRASDGGSGGEYLGGYALFRVLMTWMIGVWGMKQKGIWSKMPLIPLWDAIAFGIWIVSFARRTIRWRGVDYFLREGKGSCACAARVTEFE